MPLNQAKLPFIIFVGLFIWACTPSQDKETYSSEIMPTFQAISLSGDSLFGKPSIQILERMDSIQSRYMDDSFDIENIIWFGRFTAYSKNYTGAIDIYTNGMKEYPADPRLYRHRGHRYISIREFDLAIRDLAYAASLVEGEKNQVEPDGMPNSKNIPVSTLHGNIWYHLGLAYYLKQDWENAIDAYQNCLQSSGNHDNVVSATHWLYMIARRMGNQALAEEFLDRIYEEMDIIENFAYHRLCLFYKGSITEEDLMDEDAALASQAAVLYGLGNWHYYNGNEMKSKEIYSRMLEGNNWDSFGYIAAEADYVNIFLD